MTKGEGEGGAIGKGGNHKGTTGVPITEEELVPPTQGTTLHAQQGVGYYWG